MYPTYELALQRQAEIRVTVGRQRLARQARSGSRATGDPALPASKRLFRLTGPALSGRSGKPHLETQPQARPSA